MFSSPAGRAEYSTPDVGAPRTMTETSVLKVLLLLSLGVAPLGTHRFFFPRPSRIRAGAHAVALLCVSAGLLVPAPLLCVGWLLFTSLTFVSFLLYRGRTVWSADGLAACVPFLFSNVAAIWLVGGSNDLRILGYGPAFSYYAALHGTVLGWTLLGALAMLASQPGESRRIHLAAVFVGFVSFLLIALGIDQLRALKPVGVLGITVAIPMSQLFFLRHVWPRNKPAFTFGCLSLVGLAFTMALAWRNELGIEAFAPMLGVRGMVSVHGVVNAVVVGPAFLLAVALDLPSAERV